MRIIAIFSIVSIILLAGCTGQVAKTETSEKIEQPVENPKTELPKPQVTSTEGVSQEAEITTVTTTEIKEAPEPSQPSEPEILPQPSEPKTYHINIVQGIGIREGAG